MCSLTRCGDPRGGLVRRTRWTQPGCRSEYLGNSERPSVPPEALRGLLKALWGVLLARGESCQAPHDQAGGLRFQDTPGSARFRSLQAQIPTHFLPLIWDLAWGEILSLKWSPGLPGPGAAPAALSPPGTQRKFHTASLPGHPSFASLLPAPPPQPHLPEGDSASGRGSEETHA